MVSMTENEEEEEEVYEVYLKLGSHDRDYYFF